MSFASTGNEPPPSPASPWLRILFWTILIAALTVLDLQQTRNTYLTMARDEANIVFAKDAALRLWAASHGGVYVPLTKTTRPSPFLIEMAERDVTTTSGKHLTLISPSVMADEVLNSFSAPAGIKGGVTRRRPLNPDNAPDPWQQRALDKIAAGADEVLETTEINDEPYLRLMRPMRIRDECLYCHDETEIQPPNTLGGASISLPLAPFLKRQWQAVRLHLLFIIILWLLGSGCILLTDRSRRRAVKAHRQREAELQTACADLQKQVTQTALVARQELESQQEELARCQKEAAATAADRADLTRIFDTTTEALCVIDRSYTVQRVNDTFRQLFTNGDEEIIGKKCFAAWQAPICRTEQCPLQSLTSNATGIRLPGLERQGRDGTLRPVCFTATPLRDPSGEVIGILESFREAAPPGTTGTGAAEPTRLGALSHNFNNILTAIIGHAELAINQPIAEVKESIHQILEAALRGKNLIEQQPHTAAPTMSPVSMASLVRDTGASLRATLPESMEIRQEILADNDVIQADPTRIRQLLTKLCGFARRTMLAGDGVLEMALDRIFFDEQDEQRPATLSPGHYLRFRATGNGGAATAIGQEPAEGKTGPTPLSAFAEALAMAEEYGGTVREEHPPGRRKTFTAFLPALTPARSNVRPNRQAPTPARGGAQRILLVDDEEVLVAMTKQFMTELGYRVDGETSPLAALTNFRNNPHRYDLIITDQNMPQLSGLQLAEAMLALRPDLPIILYTGYSETAHVERAREIGIRGLLKKPVAASKLARTVRTILADGNTTPTGTRDA